MIALTLGLSVPSVAVLVHVVLCRWLPRGVRMLALPVLCLVSFIVLSLGALAAGLSLTPDDWFLAIVLSSSLIFAYMLLFIGVVHDSPTLAIVNAIDASGPKGMSLELWDGFVIRHPFVRSRLDALVAAGVVKREGQVLSCRGEVGPLVHLSDIYMRFCRYDMRAG